MSEPSRDVVVGVPLNAGEVIDLADTPTVGRAIRELQNWYEMVYRPLVRELQAAAIARADQEGRWTLRYGSLMIEVDSPNSMAREWRAPEEMRDELIKAGLPEERAYEVVTRKVLHEVAWAEAKKLMSVPAYAAIIEGYVTEVPKTRRVRVKGGK